MILIVFSIFHLEFINTEKAHVRHLKVLEKVGMALFINSQNNCLYSVFMAATRRA